MAKRFTEVKQGVRLAVAWLLGMAWLGLVFGGMGIALTQNPYSQVLGWALLALATVIALWTMDRWVKAFPGLLAYGVLGGILTLVTGHAVNHPEVVVSRLEGVIIIVFFITATALSLTFAKRELFLVDRFALFAFLVCFFWQAAAPKMMRLALGSGLLCLLLAWVCSQIRQRRRSDHQPSHPNHVMV